MNRPKARTEFLKINKKGVVGGQPLDLQITEDTPEGAKDSLVKSYGKIVTPKLYKVYQVTRRGPSEGYGIENTKWVAWRRPGDHAPVRRIPNERP